MTIRRGWWSIALLCVGCSEYELKGEAGDDAGGAIDIEVSPLALEFLGAGAGEVVERSFTITNVGVSRATLDDVALEALDSFSLPERAALPPHLDPGEWTDVRVTFTPEASGERVGTALVRSNDPDEPEIPVELTGWGLVPELRITPQDHDFGGVPVGCDDDVVLTLENIGDAELELTDLSMTGDAGFSLAWAPEMPFRLAPGGRTEAIVAFAPEALGAASSTVTATSNEPRGERDATQRGEGGGGDPQSDRATFEPNPPVDLLFAIDQSCSMDDDAARVSAEFGPLVAAIGAVTTGWQVGVVTLDSGCVNDALFDASATNLEARFTAAALLGEDRDLLDDERLLKLSHRALAQAIPGGCNDGLLREDAALHLIVVSDEPERSVQERSSWTWDHWLDAITDAAPDAASILVSGIVDKDGCSDGDAGYAEAIAATGGAHLSLCSADWSGYADALAEATLSRAWVVPLSGEPIAETLAVTVGGVETSDWAYRAGDNAVSLGADPGSAEVVVTYEVAPSCE